MSFFKPCTAYSLKLIHDAREHKRESTNHGSVPKSHVPVPTLYHFYGCSH